MQCDIFMEGMRHPHDTFLPSVCVTQPRMDVGQGFCFSLDWLNVVMRQMGGGMYRARLKRDIDRWMAKGLISEREAHAMLLEHDSQASSFSIGGVLLILSAVLLSAAILLLVAANWQAIPRLVKVSAVITLIWGFHCGGAVALALGRRAAGQALLVLGTATFGGGLALVGQLYHLSGEPLDLFYVWIAAATLSCLLFRASVMVGFVAVLCVATVAMALDQYNFDWTTETLLPPPGFAVLILALSFWPGHERVRHVAFVLLLGWLIWLYAQHMQVALAIAFVLGGFVVFAVAGSSRVYALHIWRLVTMYSLILAIAGLAIINIEYDHGLPLAVVALAALAMSVAALVIKGRDDGMVRALAYLIFVGETLYISFTTIETMLNTSGFFLISGLLVALLAFGVSRLEKMLSAARAAEKGGRGDA